MLNVRELYERIEFEDLLYFSSFDSRETTLIRVRSPQLSVVLVQYYKGSRKKGKKGEIALLEETSLSSLN